MPHKEASQAFFACSPFTDRLTKSIADFGLGAVAASGYGLFEALF
jgi:hypothetical protein